MLSIFGGKITTYRKLAEHAMAELASFFPQARAAWTAGADLPGGDMDDFERFLAHLTQEHPEVAPDVLRRLARAYGTRVTRILAGGLGEDLGGGLTTAEVDYLVAQEWAKTAEDVLYRRSKLGLHVPDGTEARLVAYLAAR